MNHKPLSSTLCLISAAALSVAAAPTTVQIDVSSILNIRVVYTYSGSGSVSSFNEGIDGWDAEATDAAATKFGNNNGHCMRDDGFYAADGTHPDIQLNYSNSNPTAGQARKMANNDTISFPVTPGAYQYLAIFGTGSNEDYSNGVPNLNEVMVTPKYKEGDGATVEADFPDWYPGTLSGAPKGLFLIASNLAKWDKNGGRAEDANHSVYGFPIQVDPAKTLQRVFLSVKLAKDFTFWGAVGQTLTTGLATTAQTTAFDFRTTGRSAQLTWPAGERGHWSLMDLQGNRISAGSGAGISQIEPPQAGVFLIRAESASGEKVFRFLSAP